MVIHLCSWAWLATSTLSLFGWSYWSLGVSSDCGVWLMASLPKKTWFDVWATTFRHSDFGRVGIVHSTDGLWGTLRKGYPAKWSTNCVCVTDTSLSHWEDPSISCTTCGRYSRLLLCGMILSSSCWHGDGWFVYSCCPRSLLQAYLPTKR